MTKIKLNIAALFKRESTDEHVIVLEEENGGQKLPIVIGPSEAQSIAIHLEDVVIKRPLTHDFCVNIAKASDSKILHVVLTNYVEGIFHAQLLLEKYDGGEVKIDCRPSDAIAVAIRSGIPIYALQSVLSVSGMSLDDKGKLQVQSDTDLSNYSTQDLKELLDDAIQKEDYSLAASIRNELKGREE